MYIIKDWSGNVIFSGHEFDTFDAGWDFLLALDFPEGDYADYFLELK